MERNLSFLGLLQQRSSWVGDDGDGGRRLLVVLYYVGGPLSPSSETLQHEAPQSVCTLSQKQLKICILFCHSKTISKIL